MLTLLAFIISLCSPLVLLVAEQILPYPYVIEEAFKLFIVSIVIRSERLSKGNRLGAVVISGGLFAFSESMFYLAGILASGNLVLFPRRLFLTGVLHVVTMLLLYVFGRRRFPLPVIGYLLAVVVHYSYNLLMASFRAL